MILRAKGEGPPWSCRKWKYSFSLQEVRRWKGEASGDNATLQSPRSFAGNWVLKLVAEPGACLELSKQEVTGRGGGCVSSVSVSCTVLSLLTTAAHQLLVSEALSSHCEAEAPVWRTASGHREDWLVSVTEILAYLQNRRGD